MADVRKIIGGLSRIKLPPAENSRLTQIATTGGTYEKARDLLDAAGATKRIDYGAGRGHGANIIGGDSFEPFAPPDFNPTFRRSADIPSEAYDGLTNLNVLNVLDPRTRDEAVDEIGRILRSGGTGIVTTRGKDVMGAKGVPGEEPMSLIIGQGDKARYQKGFRQDELLEYLYKRLGNSFDINSLPLGAAGARVDKKAEGGLATYADGGRVGAAIRILSPAWQWKKRVYTPDPSVKDPTHNDAMDTLYSTSGATERAIDNAIVRDRAVAGFTTSDGRFVDRQAAWDIAKEAGQVAGGRGWGDALYHYDLMDPEARKAAGFPEQKAEGGLAQYAGGGVVKRVMNQIAQAQGGRRASRVERAADEIPHLADTYSEEALLETFKNRGIGVSSMAPKQFEELAYPIPLPQMDELEEYKGHGKSIGGFEGYIDHLAKIAKGGGFSSVPNLTLSRRGEAFGSGPEKDIIGPFVHGHEGRHRMRALDRLGYEHGLVTVTPGDIRSALTSKDGLGQLDIQRMNEFLKKGVKPEAAVDGWGDEVYQAFPEVYAEGGPVQLNQGGQPRKPMMAPKAMVDYLREIDPNDNLKNVVREDRYKKVFGHTPSDIVSMTHKGEGTAAPDPTAPMPMSPMAVKVMGNRVELPVTAPKAVSDLVEGTSEVVAPQTAGDLALGAVLSPMARPLGIAARSAIGGMGLASDADAAEAGIGGLRRASMFPIGKNFTVIQDWEKRLLDDGKFNLWEDQGVYKGPDGLWRFEIDDSGMKVKDMPSKPGSIARISDYIDHEALRHEYPDVMDIPVTYAPDQAWHGGFYQPPGGAAPEGITISKEGFVQDPNKFKDLILHEAQHAIQNREGFTPGAAPEYALRRMKNEIDDGAAGVTYTPGKMSQDDIDLARAMHGGLDAMPEEVRKMLARNAYMRNYGEVEARNVERRKDLPMFDTKPDWDAMKREIIAMYERDYPNNSYEYMDHVRQDPLAYSDVLDRRRLEVKPGRRNSDNLPSYTQDHDDDWTIVPGAGFSRNREAYEQTVNETLWQKKRQEEAAAAAKKAGESGFAEGGSVSALDELMAMVG